MARTRRGWTNVDVNLTITSDGDVDPLEVVRGITQGARKLDGALRDAVRSARGRGDTWEAIAEALSVTRQSAWERFKSVDEDPDDVVESVIGSLKGRLKMTTDEMRRIAREEEAELEARGKTS